MEIRIEGDHIEENVSFVMQTLHVQRGEAQVKSVATIMTF